MDHIRTLLPKVLHKRGIYGEADAALLKHHALEWLHGKLPAYCEAGEIRVQNCKNNVLSIASTHSIAAQECHMLTQDLFEHLVQKCGHSRLESIRIERR